jgi:hypothetical protein
MAKDVSASGRHPAVAEGHGKMLRSWSENALVRQLQQAYLDSERTSADLAERCQVKRSTIYRWLIHPSVSIPFEKFEELAELLDLELTLKPRRRRRR